MTPDPAPEGGESAFGPALRHALAYSSLPGDLADLDDVAMSETIGLVLSAAQDRVRGQANLSLDGQGGKGVTRRMRIVVINDDMPFLVDSIAAALNRRRIDVHRLLHPIMRVERDDAGRMVALDSSQVSPESFIYLEVDRADAKARREIEADLVHVLDDVRSAVADWTALRSELAASADVLTDVEGSTFLRWLLERHFTLLGRVVEDANGVTAGNRLGILRNNSEDLWTPKARAAAIEWFKKGNPAPLLVKADRHSTVHRDAPLDLVILPRLDGDEASGFVIYAGLWTSAALRADPEDVPILRARFRAIEDRHGFHPAAHSGKALRHAFSNLPHDILVELDEQQIERLVLTAMSLADRPRPKLVLTHDPLRRRIFAFAWVQQEGLTPLRRASVERFLEREVGASVEITNVARSEGRLMLLTFELVRSATSGIASQQDLDARFETMMRGWAAELESELIAVVGAGKATRLMLGWGGAFPPHYRDTEQPASAAADLIKLDALDGSTNRGARLFENPHDHPERFRLNLYRLGAPIELSEAVPVLENFGFDVVDQMPVPLLGRESAFIHQFTLRCPITVAEDALRARALEIETAIAATLDGRAENDGFNSLLMACEIDLNQAMLFRAWFRYLRQTGLNLGLSTIVDVLRRSPEITRTLTRYFAKRHDPTRPIDDGSQSYQDIEAGLADVARIEDDRILRLFRDLITAILRTNAYGTAAEEALSFKFESAVVPGLPKPRPWREIWVYSPRVEGIHLRGGPIARGGLRWSDRRDDFRTEILGLMKAQLVKNAVIVPTGAKGGFYAKQLPSGDDREAWMAEGTEAYRVFIRALLSITDNLVDGKVVHPRSVRIRDDDDPYLVVAADKGTASFSDTANAIALESGFWLGDAFASGGSVGYDHKSMGITARGAWVSVQRHFAELGINIQTEPVKVVGCGDMSGDVFGNGMLLSRSLRLLAAFDHRHIFLDPDPDPEKSFWERWRLFSLGRSSWADYSKIAISAGGGVYSRSQKRISLSEQVRAMLGVETAALDPAALIAAILRADIDLIWFGGIGTYVKAGQEAHSAVGDPANDVLRVDAEELRARVIGEGANLAITQAGRVAFARAGGRINTDFVDNSAGVDCSDNEVNIKIALAGALSEGRLSIERRVPVLAAMTKEVGDLVLKDNRLQTLALSISEQSAVSDLPAHIRLIEQLEEQGRFDRAVEGLPGSVELSRLSELGMGFTRPELAILMAHAKLAVQAALEGSDVPGNGRYRALLHESFPSWMQYNVSVDIDRHRLASQIVATKIANRVVNRLGITAVFELARTVGSPIEDVANAYFAADSLFGFEMLFQKAERSNLAPEAVLAALMTISQIATRQVLDLLKTANTDRDPWLVANRFGDGVKRMRQSLVDDDIEITGALGEPTLDDEIDRLKRLDGAVGMTALALKLGIDEIAATAAFLRLKEEFYLEWWPDVPAPSSLSEQTVVR